MRLVELFREIPHIVRESPEVEICGIAVDSKRVQPGWLFVAVRGERYDGHDYLDEAMERGAVAAVVEREPILRPLPTIIVRDTRAVVAELAARWHGSPGRRLVCVGVTGTNGKTTTTYLTDRILQAAGYRAGLIGTISYRIGDRSIPATNTTPGALDLQAMLAEMVQLGLGHCVMEVSSHALEQHRVHGIPFRVAVFTNLSQDHLDYHRTMDRYFAAKAKLFEALTPQAYAVINLDDPWGRRLLRRTRAQVITFGFHDEAMLRPRQQELTLAGSRFRVQTPAGELAIRSPLLGRPNLMNSLAAIGVGLALGVRPDAIQQGIAALPLVPGRLEPINGLRHEGSGPTVIVDYAHTEEALRQALTVLRELCHERITVVFGCGGNRDQGKRPKMGRVASELADEVVITTDNPRGEDPAAIAQAVVAGVRPGCREARILLDRRQAIEAAIQSAQAKGGVVLLAGKGHETCQIMKETMLPFDDREEARRCLQLMRSSA